MEKKGKRVWKVVTQQELNRRQERQIKKEQPKQKVVPLMRIGGKVVYSDGSTR